MHEEQEEPLRLEEDSSRNAFSFSNDGAQQRFAWDFVRTGDSTFQSEQYPEEYSEWYPEQYPSYSKKVCSNIEKFPVSALSDSYKEYEGVIWAQALSQLTVRYSSSGRGIQEHPMSRIRRIVLNSAHFDVRCVVAPAIQKCLFAILRRLSSRSKSPLDIEPLSEALQWRKCVVIDCLSRWLSHWLGHCWQSKTILFKETLSSFKNLCLPTVSPESMPLSLCRRITCLKWEKIEILIRQSLNCCERRTSTAVTVYDAVYKFGKFRFLENVSLEWLEQKIPKKSDCQCVCQSPELMRTSDHRTLTRHSSI